MQCPEVHFRLYCLPMLHPTFSPLSALSPLDGRYAGQMGELRAFFSEEALFHARTEVEIRYFIALSEEKGVTELPALNAKQKDELLALARDFSVTDAERIKEIEKTTRHDVKAVEYFIKEKVRDMRGLGDKAEFIHFALTSEDVNNLSYGLLIHDALKYVIIPTLEETLKSIRSLAKSTKTLKLLSLTHGQPATPTTLGKEMEVFALRIERQLKQLRAFRMQGKFGGAVGNFSAHKAAYPKVRWETFRQKFVKALGLDPLAETTQINPHDDYAELSHLMSRINTILLDFSRDQWLYISRGVFKQKVIAGEVGSSAMPHKVNPIDFENAEGNLGLSTALFTHFAEKLPVSRLQRDLSDSTVQRSIGVAFGYHLLAVTSIQKGLGRITVDKAVLARELADHPEVIAEAVQTVLRRNGVEGAYEKLKELTRGNRVSRKDIEAYLDDLPVSAEEKSRLKKML